MRMVLRGSATVLLLASLLTAPVPALADPDLTDATLAREVDRALIQDPALPESGITVAVSGGVVALGGSVPNLLSANRAAAVAAAVPGVRSVVDALEFDLSPRADDEIAEALTAALLAEPAIELDALRFEVEGGRVVLIGSTGSWFSARLAERLAQGLPGVRRVESRLALEDAPGRRDAALMQEVRSALRWDPLLDPRRIGVRSEQGRVRLEGWVGSSAARERAARDAYVGGVQEVAVERLALRPERVARGAPAVRTDQALRIAVEDGLILHPATREENVAVTVERGRATLQGSVSSLVARRAAARIVRHTPGVLELDDRIEVKPAPPVRDETVAQRLLEALRGNPLIAGRDITVVVREGVVQLSGTIGSTLERAEVERVAAAVPGAVELRNELSLEESAPPPGFNPYLAALLEDTGWQGARPVRSDETDRRLAQRIRDRLWGDPALDQSKVLVRVVDGVAVLSGILPDREQRAAAGEAAQTAGARAVSNLLAIDPGQGPVAVDRRAPAEGPLLSRR